MYSSMMLKGTILVLFLCCHIHLSTAKDVGDKIVTTGILGGISTAATKAVATAVRPFYKFFVEGGTGLITRYFTMSDYFGIGNNIRKGLVFTGSKVGSAGLALGSAVNLFAKKRLQEQAEEMNRWWMQQKLETVNSIKSGIAGGVGWAAAVAIGDKFGNKNNGNSESAVAGGDAGGGDAGGGDAGGGDAGGDDAAGADAGGGEEETTTKTTTTTTTTTSNPFGVSISDQFYASPWAIPGSAGAISSSSVFDIFGKPVKGSDSSVSSSQVVIGKPVGEQTGEADTSSTVTFVQDTFNWLSGASASEDGSSNNESGCNRRCRKEKARSRKSNRRSRSVDGADVDPLAAVFKSVAREDPQQCLPLVLCAIHADPRGLLTQQETKLVNAFRPLVIHRHAPSWAGPWVRGARQGASASHGKTEEGNTTCRKAFPNCPFSAHYLRSLMAETFDVNPQNEESRKDVHLELNLVEP